MALASLSSLTSSAVSLAFKKLGGDFEECPEDAEKKLSDQARKLFVDAFEGLDCSKIIDYHTHIVGQDTSETGCYCHPSHFSGRTPGNLAQRFKANLFMSASGMSSDDPDAKFVDRLLSLNRSFCPKRNVQQDGGHMRNCILALDYIYTQEGRKDAAQSTMHIPNSYVIKLAAENSDSFIPVCSVHPFRKDAIDQIQKFNSLGIRMIKWLPNSQLIPPDHEKCIPFYDEVHRLDMFILCHTGSEHALTAGLVDDEYGNPLRLKLALDRGVKVIMAHCASEGTFPDLEHPGENGKCPSVTGMELFLRLMKRDAYKKNLFGDISALPTIMRSKHLPTLLKETEIHDRLIFGSDYPVPAITSLTSTQLLRSWFGILTKEQCTALNEIYTFNPLLYDFVLKRTVSCEGKKFPVSVFQEHEALRVSGIASPEVLLQSLPAQTTHDPNEDTEMYENDEALFGSPGHDGHLEQS